MDEDTKNDSSTFSSQLKNKKRSKPDDEQENESKDTEIKKDDKSTAWFTELPEEIKSVDFSQGVSWGKYHPYPLEPHVPLLSDATTTTTTTTGTETSSSPMPPLVPEGTPPVFPEECPGLCFHLNGISGRARACTIHFPSSSTMGTIDTGDGKNETESCLYDHRPPVHTPRFMPVGTKGTLKGVLPEELEALNCPIILGNTYHLAIQPGTDIVRDHGGLASFMGGTSTQNEINKDSPLETEKMDVDCDDNDNSEIAKLHRKSRRRLGYNLLTDSGGFQMVSLAALSEVTEEGVVFENPFSKNGETMLLRPEDSIKYQTEIGADIIMALDDVVSSVTADDTRFQIATYRTLRWYDRCRQAQIEHRIPPENQNLFPITQGGLDVSRGGLREQCLAGFRHRDTTDFPNQESSISSNDKSGSSSTTKKTSIPGFAIGGLAGGEDKDDFWKVVDLSCKSLPDCKPRYLMGVGYPVDVVVCTALGVDMYDCVYPTRTARFGVALIPSGTLRLQNYDCGAGADAGADAGGDAADANAVIQQDCPCPACSRGVTRKRIHQLLKSKNPLPIQLLTQHNITYMMRLVNDMRHAIMKNEFPQFVRQFLQLQFLSEESEQLESTDKTKSLSEAVPKWIRDSLNAAGISLDEDSSNTSELEKVNGN